MALQRVQKLMSNAGFCSRRKAEELIERGTVRVNGKIIKLGDKATENDEIIIAGNKLEFERRRYIKFYKPRYVATTLYDPYKKDTIVKFLDNIHERVFPVGRLDFDAEGLLLLTNDGDFANKVMHPRYETVKVYQAKTRDEIRKKDIENLKGKIKLKDGPVRVEYTKAIDHHTVEIAIHEGRNKIVKRIFKQLGFYVDKLKRVQIGNIQIGNMKPGQMRELTKEEINLMIKDHNHGQGKASLPQDHKAYPK